MGRKWLSLCVCVFGVDWISRTALAGVIQLKKPPTTVVKKRNFFYSIFYFYNRFYTRSFFSINFFCLFFLLSRHETLMTTGGWRYLWPTRSRPCRRRLIPFFAFLFSKFFDISDLSSFFHVWFISSCGSKETKAKKTIISLTQKLHTQGEKEQKSFIDYWFFGKSQSIWKCWTPI